MNITDISLIRDYREDVNNVYSNMSYSFGFIENTPKYREINLEKQDIIMFFYLYKKQYSIQLNNRPCVGLNIYVPRFL